MIVQCVNTDKNVGKFGRANGNINDLEVGKTYTVKDVEVHTWHTLYTLRGITGTFNSCHFTVI